MPDPIIFLSDTHLDVQETKRLAAFISFLRECEDRKAYLYILGDLFNFWAGDAQGRLRAYRALFAEMKRRKEKIFFLPGNRDFLFPPYWKRQGGQVLPDGSILPLGELRLLLYHGDILNTKDVVYLQIRRYLQSRLIYQLSRLLPTSGCLAIGRKLRKTSQACVQKKSISLLSPDLAFAYQLLEENHCNFLLCGHFHSWGGVTLPSEASPLCILPESIGTIFRYLVWEDNSFRWEESLALP